MSILYLFTAIIAVLAGFIGLVVIIKGFVDKNNRNINLGTILISVALIIAISSAYCIGRRAIHSYRYQKNEQMKMQNCMKNCDFDMMKCCDAFDSTAVDSNGVKIVSKVMMDKKCEKMCKQACKKHMN